MQKAGQIRDLMTTGAPIKVEVASFGGAVTAAEFSAGGATYRFEPNTVGAKQVMWSLSSLPEAHVVLYSGTQEVKRFEGQGVWALFRLMDAAQKENAGPTAFKVTFGQGAQFATFKITLPSDRQSLRPRRDVVVPLSGKALSGLSVFAFGKLPAHGDFVARGLGASERDAWDAWASDSLERARRDLGEAFEAEHDQAPPWRFAFGPGRFAQTWVAGALTPSIDRGGRRFVIVAWARGADGPAAARARAGQVAEAGGA